MSGSYIKSCLGSHGSQILGTHSAIFFLLGTGTVMCGTVKRTPWVPFTHTQKRFAKEKREHVDENGVRCFKVKKLKVKKASGATINASCCRNQNGSCVLGLDYYLEHNYMRWNCAMKCDSHNKKCKNDTHSWCECVQCREVIALHSKEHCIGLLTKIKEEDVEPLTVKSNAPEWFCTRRFSFTFTTAIEHTRH